MTTVTISKAEYARLKKIDRRFRDFFAYLEHLLDVSEARKEVKQKRVISQEQLFRRLGV